MYICICNALTDSHVKQAIGEAGSTRPSEVYAACGCRAQCGNCVKKLLGILRDLADQGAGELQGAD
ncbi:(2Fe-2S)-binding protein [Limobrevibacterium gyesilva]|uniref:Bacterioferritin-associated ferredoxin n=1 Tax=Limobrevibacterium gyesilva TaxID=2991712 RepID=A0AA41YJH3_9PROT|nr:(2Fe-2S)-binding protein [Limobrevibacterium gyesilva]